MSPFSTGSSGSEQEIEYLAPGTPVDLTNCDREPIHIPSSVQPHGMLLAAREFDQQIAYVSRNAPQFLGVEVEAILGMTLAELLGQEGVDAIVRMLGSEKYAPANILTLTFPVCPQTRFDVQAHRANGLLCVELEPASGESGADLVSTQLMRAIKEFHNPKTPLGLVAVACELMRSFTGYDRVMVYRFDADGHGEVIAEEKAAELESYLGLHYPATDIPAQARRMYLLQRIRTIVDMGYSPVPILANAKLVPDEPLDMTYCGLRSVSPMHVEYLQNMGIAASHSISLVIQNRLWGLIICHHYSPKHPSAEMRSISDIMGQLISSQLAAALAAEEFSERRLKNALLDLLVAALEPRTIAEKLADEAKAMMALVAADGAVIQLEGDTQWLGVTPSHAEARIIHAALDSRVREDICFADHLSAMFPEFAGLTQVASGALLVRIKDRPGDSILWFRGEVTQTVTWGGKRDEAKLLDESTLRLSPRKSFARWEEVHRGQSLPWRGSEIEAARDLAQIVARTIRLRSEHQESRASFH